MTEKDKQRITMEQFNDISKHVEKAQGDKARFLKSKEGLLPHFEFPNKEAQQEKHYSKETLLADIMDERIEKAKEMMENPVLLENTYQYLQDNTTKGSGRRGENIADASWTFHTLSTFISTDFLSRLSPEKQNNINSYLKNQTLLENTYKFLQDHATQGSKEEGEDTINASWAFETLSALITTHTFSLLSPERQNKMNAYLENSILLENAYRSLQDAATRGSEEEKKDANNASWAFDTLSAFITTHSISHLSPKKQNEINSYLKNSILLENTYQYLQSCATQGSEKEGKYTNNASWALQTLSSLTIVKDYLREKGKKIDDETFANEALNPTEKIPPRPEGRLGK